MCHLVDKEVEERGLCETYIGERPSLLVWRDLVRALSIAASRFRSLAIDESAWTRLRLAGCTDFKIDSKTETETNTETETEKRRDGDGTVDVVDAADAF